MDLRFPGRSGFNVHIRKTWNRRNVLLHARKASACGMQTSDPDKGTYGEHSGCSLLRIKPVFERRTFVSSALECIIKGNCIFVNPKFAEKCIKVHVFFSRIARVFGKSRQVRIFMVPASAPASKGGQRGPVLKERSPRSPRTAWAEGN